ncbi:MAG: hemerythrin domain-containing protein [Gammaproteobacteria bacterium]|nr:hemerythrin domain-containing protein [Gammaproteobacteria bacterium]
MNIKEFMAQDHKDCDLIFAQAEATASAEDWGSATRAVGNFIKAMERHLDIEEIELFPAFEEKTGMTMGPTQMMRMEHDQMRALFTEMRNAIEEKQSDNYLDIAETLLILMQQHNMKEEQILYTMMDQHLSDESDYFHQKLLDWNKD